MPDTEAGRALLDDLVPHPVGHEADCRDCGVLSDPLTPAPNVPECTCDRDDDSWVGERAMPLCPYHEDRLRARSWESLACMVIDYEVALATPPIRSVGIWEPTPDPAAREPARPVPQEGDPLMAGYHGDGEFDLHYDPQCPQCTARRDRLMPDHGMDAVYASTHYACRYHDEPCLAHRADCPQEPHCRSSWPSPSVWWRATCWE